MLGTEKKVRVLHDLPKEEPVSAPESMESEGRGNGPALWISFIAVIVAMVAYFAVDYKITAIEAGMKVLPALETKVGSLETQVADLNSLPAKVKRQMVADQLAELTTLMQRVSGNLDNDQHKALAAKVSELMMQLQAQIDASAAK